MREYRVIPDGDEWVLEYPPSLHAKNRNFLASKAVRLMRQETGPRKLTVLDQYGNVEHEIIEGVE